VDSYLNEKFKGIVTEIATSANVSGISADQVTNFDVKIRMLPESYSNLKVKGQPAASPFRPGMSATVDIRTESAYRILSIPIQAVTTRQDTTASGKKSAEKKPGSNPESGQITATDAPQQEIVFVVSEGKAVRRNIKTGIQDNAYIQILEGLDVGEEVVTGPYRAVSRSLNDGDAIKVVAKEDLFEKKK